MACTGWNHSEYCPCDWGNRPKSWNKSMTNINWDISSRITRTHTATHTSYSTRSRGSLCKHCLQLIYWVTHNEGKIAFDELCYPWVIHDCLGIWGHSARGLLGHDLTHTLSRGKDDWLVGIIVKIDLLGATEVRVHIKPIDVDNAIPIMILVPMMLMPQDFIDTNLGGMMLVNSMTHQLLKVKS